METRLIMFGALLAAVLVLAACSGPQSSATEASATEAAASAATVDATVEATVEATAEVTTEVAAASVEATPTHDMAAMVPGEVMTGMGEMGGMN